MMSRRSLACLAVTALAMAVLLVAAEPASAQLRRGFSRGYGNPYNEGSVPGYYSNVQGYNSWGVPSYYGEGMEGDFYGPFSGARFGSYGALSGAGSDNNVLINVRVLPNAEVWFEGQRTSQTGSFRSFMSPPLDSDREFVYQIRARWTEDGRQVDKIRKIHVYPGDRLLVNFIKPMRGTLSGQFGTEPETRGDDR